MPKKQHTVKLFGYTKKGVVASTHNAVLVRSFRDIDNKFVINFNGNGTVSLYTAKEHYILTKHRSANRYQGICNSTNVHFCPKKIKATLIYWA